MGTGLGGLLEQAIHSATGVPRLYTAAIRAGLGPSGAMEVLLVSQAALAAAAKHGRGVPGRSNAMRHFLWQAVLTARFGAEVARSVAAAQETGTSRARDSRVDEHNNAAGQAYGAAHAGRLSAGSAGDAVDSLVPEALAMWEAGELVWVRPR